MARVRFLEVPASDGFSLAATRFEPETHPSAGGVVIASACGVPRGFYGRFASSLADQGLTVWTFDYRGIGGSRPRSLRGFAARMLDWAQRDLAGVVAFAAEETGARPALVGHSFGGQALGLLPDPNAVVGALTVAAQCGWLGLWPRRYRPLLVAMWFALMPASTRVAGYFPGALFAMGESLPAGVALQWARWCRHPRWVWGDPEAAACAAHARFSGPLRAISFADDCVFAPKRAVDALAALHERATVERVHLHPRDLGVARLGHWSFFRDVLREPLWRDALRWLCSALA